MTETDQSTNCVGLAEFLTSLLRETAEAVHRSQLEQSESDSELRAIASLDIEAAAETLVTLEAAQLYFERLLAESGADSAWPTRHTHFIKIAEERLGVALSPIRDYTKRGLKNTGRSKLLTAVRKTIAADQLISVHRLLGEGTHRVKIASGTIAVKLELRTQNPQEEAPSEEQMHKADAARIGTTAAAAILEPRTRKELRIVVRPAQREDGAAAGVFGEVTINFIVV